MAHEGTLPTTKVINVNQWLEGAKFNGFHATVLLLGVGLFTFDGYDLVIYGAAVPLLMKAFHVGPAQMGAIAGYALVGAMIGALVFGALADKIGRKKTILYCIGLFSLCMGLTGFTNSPLTFGICRFFMGLAVGGSMPNMVAISSEYSPLQTRTIMGGWVTSGMQFGGILAALIALYLFAHFSWRSVFFVGAVPLLLLPLYVKSLPESPLHLLKNNRLDSLRAFLKRARPAEPLPPEAILEVKKGSGKASIAAIFQEHRGFSTVVICIMFFMNMYIIFAFTVWLPKLMMNVGYSLASGLFFLLMLQAVSLVGVGMFGSIADRVGGRPALVMAYLAAFVFIVLVPYAHNFALLAILVGLAGFGFNGAQGTACGYVGSFYPPAMRSTGMGLAYASGRLGAILGPAITGILMALHLSYRANMVVIASPGILAAICVILVRDQYNFGRQQQELARRATAAHA